MVNTRIQHSQILGQESSHQYSGERHIINKTSGVFSPKEALKSLQGEYARMGLDSNEIASSIIDEEKVSEMLSEDPIGSKEKILADQSTQDKRIRSGLLE